MPQLSKKEQKSDDPKDWRIALAGLLTEATRLISDVRKLLDDERKRKGNA